MSKVFTKMEELASHAKDYINTKIDQVKLNTAEKTSSVLANIIAGRIVAKVFIFFLVFSSIAGAYALSGWIGETYAGFLIVAGFYLLTGFVVWLGKERIIRIPVMNSIIRQLFKNIEGNEED